MNVRRKSVRRKISLLTALMGIVMSAMLLSACQKTPKESIVKEKDFDKMIEQARGQSEDNDDSGKGLTTEESRNNNGALTENSGNDNGLIKEENGSENGQPDGQSSNTYSVTIENENLHVGLSGEADIEAPQADSMSVIRIWQKTISQEMVDRLLNKVLPEEKLYDGYATFTRTRQDVEAEITRWKQEITEMENKIAGGSYTEEEGRKYLTEYQKALEQLAEQYQQAPVQVEITDYPVDGNFRTGKINLNGRTFNNQGTDEVVYVVNDGNKGTYVSVYAQNSDLYGNYLRFRRCKNGYISCNDSMDNESEGMAPAGSKERWNAENGAHSESNYGVPFGQLTVYENEPVTISKDKAIEAAEQFLQDLDMTDEYGYYESELCCEIPNIRLYAEGASEGYRTVYVLTFLRKIDGVPVNNIAEAKSTEGWQGKDYVKKNWPGERVLVYVNDDGVVGMDINAPLEITEVVVDHSSLQSFAQISRIFEQMAVIKNANESEAVFTEITLQKVTLGYTRISARDNFEEGYLVPVWDFRGKIKRTGVETEVKTDASILTINAIDGTIIDRRLGY